MVPVICPGIRELRGHLAYVGGAFRAQVCLDGCQLPYMSRTNATGRRDRGHSPGAAATQHPLCMA